MIRIYVKRKNEIAGHVFICKSSIKGDKVAILPFIGFVTEGLITEEEWANSQQAIIDKFELCVTESYIDGRCKVARNMKRFSWRDILRMKLSEEFKPMGYKPINNSLGIEIEISKCGSMVRYRIGNKGTVSNWQNIHYSVVNNRPFFNVYKKAHGCSAYFLDEFMKI